MTLLQTAEGADSWQETRAPLGGGGLTPLQGR